MLLDLLSTGDTKAGTTPSQLRQRLEDLRLGGRSINLSEKLRKSLKGLVDEDDGRWTIKPDEISGLVARVAPWIATEHHAALAMFDTPEARHVLRAMCDLGRPGRAEDVVKASATKLTRDRAESALERMGRAGLVERTTSGSYRIAGRTAIALLLSLLGDASDVEDDESARETREKILETRKPRPTGTKSKAGADAPTSSVGRTKSARKKTRRAGARKRAGAPS